MEIISAHCRTKAWGWHPQSCLWVGADNRSAKVKERWRMLCFRVHVALDFFCSRSYPSSPPGGVNVVGDV